MKKQLSESLVPGFTHDQQLMARNQSSTDDPYKYVSQQDSGSHIQQRSVAKAQPAIRELKKQKVQEEGSRARSKSLDPENFAAASELSRRKGACQNQTQGKKMAPSVLIQNYNWIGQPTKVRAVSGFQAQDDHQLGLRDLAGQESLQRTHPEQSRVPFADLTPSPFERPHTKKEGHYIQEPVQNLNLFYNDKNADQKGKETDWDKQLQSLQIESFPKKQSSNEAALPPKAPEARLDSGKIIHDQMFEIGMEQALAQRTKNHQNSQRQQPGQAQVSQTDKNQLLQERENYCANPISSKLIQPAYDASTNYFNAYWQVYQENENYLKILDTLALERNEVLAQLISLEQSISQNQRSLFGPRRDCVHEDNWSQGYCSSKQKFDQQSSPENEETTNKENMAMNQQLKQKRKVSLNSEVSEAQFQSGGGVFGRSLPNNPELSVESELMKETHSQQVHSTRHSQRVENIPQSQSAIERYQSGRKKHQRRCANEINKDFICPYSECHKIYGSEGSLNLHMKLKHNAGSKTEREKLAKQVVQELTQSGNHREGKSVDLEQLKKINLPPGLIEKTAKELGVSLNHLNSHIKKQLLETVPRQLPSSQGETKTEQFRDFENFSDKKLISEVLANPDHLDVILQRKKQAKKKY